MQVERQRAGDAADITARHPRLIGFGVIRLDETVCRRVGGIAWPAAVKPANQVKIDFKGRHHSAWRSHGILIVIKFLSG